MKKAYTLLITIILVTLFSYIGILILETKALRNENLSNQYLGIEEGMIYTPYELTDQQIQDIEKAISKKENKKVTLKVSIDSSLLGGIKVQIANRIYDGTIKNKVEMLKKELLRK